MAIQRPLDEITLGNAAAFYASEFTKADYYDPRVPTRLIGGRTYVLNNFKSFTFKDECEFLLDRVEKLLDPDYLKVWKREINDFIAERDDSKFEEVLAKKLAITPTGEHIPGVIGTTKIGARCVGRKVLKNEIRDKKRWFGLVEGKLVEVRYRVVKEYWPVYAGEIEERIADSGVADPLPEGAEPWRPGLEPYLATNPRISNEAAIAACDAIVDRLDEGTGAAVIQGRSGAQPADPDTAVTGTLLFTLVMSDPAFGAAADANPGGRATASAITNDSSADATGTLGYCRCSATNDGATPLDDHIDGEAGTSGADFNFNTLSIVSGATVSLTSFTVTVPES